MRFCTRCGAEVSEGQRFCKKCGNEIRPKDNEKDGGPRSEDVMPTGDERVEEPGDEKTVRLVGEMVRAETDASDASFRQLADTGGADAPSVVSGADAMAEDAVSEPPKRRKRTAAIVGIAVAVVLGLGASVTLWLLGRLPIPSPLAESSESAELVVVSRTSRIVPKSASGETPSHYYVRVRRAVDDNGKDVDVSSLPDLEVEGGEGFTPYQVISDLPNGTYTFEIYDGDQVFTLPPVEIDDADDALPDDITIQMQPAQGTKAPQHSGGEEPKTTDELFLAKIEELEKEYGAPEVKVQPYGEQYLSYASGLAYAGLFDFGDGIERLVTLCLDQEAQVEWNHADYLIQVWEYDEKEEGKLVCVLNRADVSFAATGWSGSFSINPVSKGALLYLWADVTDGGELGKNIELYFGLQDGGSFGLIHELSQEYVTRGDGDDFIYQVDGAEVSADTSISVRREMERGLDPDASQSMYPQIIFSNEDEARSAKFVNAAEMLTGSFYYPGDLVERVADTKRALQERIDEENDDPSTPADSSQYASNDVTVTVCDEDVTYPTYNSGTTSDGTSTETWTYVQISGPGVEDDVASSINAALKREFEEAKRQSQAWSFESGGGGQCLSYRSLVTCSRAGVACVRVQRYCTGWGPHGWMEITDHVFDLKTGGEILPFGIVGLSEDEAKQRAVDCIVDYVLLHPGAMPYESEAEARLDAEELVEDAQFFLNDDGLAVYLPEYTMGYTYQQGVKEILVWAFDDPSLIGTDVHGFYSERVL